MLRDVFQALQTGTLAEISLLAFVIGFALILIRAFTLPKKDRDHAKHIPLDEPREDYQN